MWKKEELLRVGELCEKYGAVVVADEIHHDLIMPGYRHTVFTQVKESFADFSVICTAPSKTFNLAGMQTSNPVSYTHLDVYKRQIFESGVKYFR